jgi:hypothetical protein
MSGKDEGTGSVDRKSEEGKQESPAGGQGAPLVRSSTSENKQGHMNPSAPEDANVTPGSAGEK